MLAIYTYVSGLRAPALIAFIKDTLVYVMIIVAVFYIPTRVGGWGHIFATAEAHMKAISPVTKKPNGVFIPTTGNSQLAFSTLALGSALALMVYPHAVTGVLSTKRRDIIKRNMALLPIYSLMLGFIALLGYVALTDKVTVANVKKSGGNAQLAVPYLFQHMFPSWFAGIAFSAIIIGALVPAAIMAIAAANLFTRNIFKEFLKPDASPQLRRRGSPSGPRWWSSWARWRSRSTCRARSPSTCSCWAASGSCRCSRRSCSACSPGGSTAGRCWRAGWPAWCSAPSPPTRWPPPPRPTGPGRWTSNSVTRSTSA